MNSTRTTRPPGSEATARKAMRSPSLKREPVAGASMRTTGGALGVSTSTSTGAVSEKDPVSSCRRAQYQCVPRTTSLTSQAKGGASAKPRRVVPSNHSTDAIRPSGSRASSASATRVVELADGTRIRVPAVGEVTRPTGGRLAGLQRADRSAGRPPAVANVPATHRPPASAATAVTAGSGPPTPLSNACHATPSQRAKPGVGVAPETRNPPAAITSGPSTCNDVMPPSVPAPNGFQAVPFQRATFDASTPPAWVKRPPTKTSLPRTRSVFTNG